MADVGQLLKAKEFVETPAWLQDWRQALDRAVAYIRENRAPLPQWFPPGTPTLQREQLEETKRHNLATEDISRQEIAAQLGGTTYPLTPEGLPLKTLNDLLKYKKERNKLEIQDTIRSKMDELWATVAKERGTKVGPTIDEVFALAAQLAPQIRLIGRLNGLEPQEINALLDYAFSFAGGAAPPEYREPEVSPLDMPLAK